VRRARPQRIGRPCLLLHERLRPQGPLAEPLAVDGFESFEFSQFSPTHFHTAVGTRTHFIHGFTDSELRRRGRMSPAQRRRRATRSIQWAPWDSNPGPLA
jgi:hypothetical protein